MFSESREIAQAGLHQSALSSTRPSSGPCPHCREEADNDTMAPVMVHCLAGYRPTMAGLSCPTGRTHRSMTGSAALVLTMPVLSFLPSPDFLQSAYVSYKMSTLAVVI